MGNSESHTLHHANCYALPSARRQVPLRDEAEAAARGFVKKCDKCFTASERKAERPRDSPGAVEQ